MIQSQLVVKALSALTEEEVAGLNATYTETLAALIELAHAAREQNERLAQSAPNERGLQKVYTDEAATFAAVARALRRAQNEVALILTEGVRA